MLPPDVVRQLKRVRIRARRAVESLAGGKYRSIFRGTGLAFEEVREYQPGDDVRAIDWNVTARVGHPFIKVMWKSASKQSFSLTDGSQQTGSGRVQNAKPLRNLLQFSPRELFRSRSRRPPLFTDARGLLEPSRATSRLRLVRYPLPSASREGTSLRTAPSF